MGLLTSTVGSFPKPKELRLGRRRLAEGEIDEVALRRLEDDATRAAIALQEGLGLDLLVDGEMDRGDMTTFFAERLQGMEVSGLVRSYGNRYYRKPVIVSDVERGAPLTVARWRFAQALSTRPVKAILTGPYTLMDWSFDEHYPSREACCMALAEVIREEALDLAAAGPGTSRSTSRRSRRDRTSSPSPPRGSRSSPPDFSAGCGRGRTFATAS